MWIRGDVFICCINISMPTIITDTCAMILFASNFIYIGSFHHQTQSHYSPLYSNKVAMNNSSLIVASANIPTNQQPMMHRYNHNTYPGIVATWPPAPVHNSQSQYFHSNAPPPARTPLSNNNKPDEFYLKDALLGFFAEGQCEDLSPFCNWIDKQRKSMSREIRKHDVLLSIWNGRVKGTGFTKEESETALNYIVDLRLPSRPKCEPMSSSSPNDQVTAVVQSLEKTVRDLFSVHVSLDGNMLIGRDALLHDESFIDAMKMLKAKGVNEVPCGHSYTAKSCQSQSPFLCDAIMLVRKQANSQECCTLCAKRARKAAVSSVRNRENYTKRVAHDSKTPKSKLTPEEFHDRNQNIRNEKKRLTNVAAKLKEKINRELSDPTNTMKLNRGNKNEPPSREQQFIANVKEVFDDVLQKNRKETKKLLKDVLKTTMSSFVEHDKSQKNPVEVEERDVDNVVEFLVESMDNTSKALNGKEKQCQFSPTMMMICDSVYNTSTAAFRQAKAHSPLHIFPSERQMQRRKADNKIADGQTSKPYELKKEEMKRRNIVALNGYLECDEMKLKDGVVFRTKTNEPVGLANDMLDLETLLRRVLSDEGHTLEAATYVNQWQYVAITKDGIEFVLLEHFFNNGSLTAKTLSNQFRHVVFMCETVKMRVSGLCFDAGGNNSRFFIDVHGYKKVGRNAWLNDEDCYIVHPLDPSRRIYIWFCTTHGMKAMRNQFLSSQPSGTKAFMDENGFSFGWPFIVKLYAKHLEREKETSGKCTSGVRLTEHVVNPNKSDKMNVKYAKIAFEDKTIAFGIEMICDALGLSFDDVLEATVEARGKYINRRSESREKSFSNLKHGHYIEIAKYLMKVYKERSQGPMVSAEEAEEASLPDNSDVTDDMEEEELPDVWMELDEIDWDEVANEVDGHMGIEDASTTLNDKADESDSLGSDIASLIYMTHVNALFHNLLMCKNENISSKNVDLVEDLAKGILTYFDDWKSAQLKRKAAKIDGWEKTFLAPQTFKNLRYSCCAFIHFSRYFTQTTDIKSVPCLASNQSSIENVFSCQRRTGHDKASTYSSGIGCMTTKASIAQSTGRCYLAEDCLEGRDDNRVDYGSAHSRKAREAAEAALTKLKAKRKATADSNSIQEPLWMFAGEQPTTKRDKFKDLAVQLNMSLDSSAMDIVMGSKCFEFFARLCHDDEETFAWLEKLISSPDDFFNPIFTNITTNLLAFLEEELYCRDSSFETAILNYIASDDFHTIYVEDYFEFEGSISRLGTIAIVEAIVEYFTARVYKVISDKNVIAEDEKVTINSPCFPRMMQNIVGSAIAKSKDKFCSNDKKSPENILFSSIGIKHTDALIDEEYKKRWYPPQSQIENQGMLTLVHPQLINWSSKVVLFACNAFSNRRMIIHRGSVIQVGMKELLADKEIYNTFAKAVTEAMGVNKLQTNRLRQIYVRLSERIFHSYTGKYWYDHFNESKKSSDNTSNIQFRHQLQLQGSVNKSNVPSQGKKQRSAKPTIATILGIDEKKKKKKASSNKRTSKGDESKGSKKRRTNDDDFKATYRQLYSDEVVPKLRGLRDLKPNTIVSTNQLHKDHRLALLFVKFDIFHRENKITAATVKNLLMAELIKEENKSWSDGLSNESNITIIEDSS